MATKAESIRKRGQDLEPARKAAFAILKVEPHLRMKELTAKLADMGYKNLYPTTVHTWITRCKAKQAKAGKAGAEVVDIKRKANLPAEQRLKVKGTPPGESERDERVDDEAVVKLRAQKMTEQVVADVLKTGPPPEPLPAPTWQDVIQAVPDNETLARLVLDGFTGLVYDLRNQLADVLDDNKRLLTENASMIEVHNRMLEKIRTGNRFTVDQAKHILTPKSPLPVDDPQGGKQLNVCPHYKTKMEGFSHYCIGGKPGGSCPQDPKREFCVFAVYKATYHRAIKPRWA